MKSALTTERTLFTGSKKKYSERNILTPPKIEATEKIKIVRYPVIITMQMFLLQHQNKV